MLFAVALVAAAAPARSAGRPLPVDLELVLAVDVSGSVDAVEAQLQRDGYVKALTHADVLSAIRSGVLQRIAVTYVEWADSGYQAVRIPWTLVKDASTATRLSNAIADAPFGPGRYTSISGAISYSAELFDGNGFDGTRRVIDISGDGPNNTGQPVALARDAAVAAGLVINGLPIVNERLDRFGPQLANLDLYYKNCVIGGPGSFIVVARDFEDFAVAVRRKLVLEIAGRMPDPARGTRFARLGAPPGYAHPPLAARRGGMIRVDDERGTPDCEVGERQLMRRMKSWEEWTN